MRKFDERKTKFLCFGSAKLWGFQT